MISLYFIVIIFFRWFKHTLGAGGDDEFLGYVDYTFTRPDGTQLGNQGKYLEINKRRIVKEPNFGSSVRLVARL